jgi:hypothetical protein
MIKWDSVFLYSDITMTVRSETDCTSWAAFDVVSECSSKSQYNYQSSNTESCFITVFFAVTNLLTVEIIFNQRPMHNETAVAILAETSPNFVAMRRLMLDIKLWPAECSNIFIASSCFILYVETICWWLGLTKEAVAILTFMACRILTLPNFFIC